MRGIRWLLVALLFLVFPFELALAQAAQPEQAVGQLVSYGGAILTSLLLGTTHHFDSRITSTRAFRKAQPLITLAGAFAAPWVAQHLGATLDPSAFAAAPTATLATIAASELLSLFSKRKSG